MWRKTQRIEEQALSSAIGHCNALWRIWLISIGTEFFIIPITSAGKNLKQKSDFEVRRLHRAGRYATTLKVWNMQKWCIEMRWKCFRNSFGENQHETFLAQLFSSSWAGSSRLNCGIWWPSVARSPIHALVSSTSPAWKIWCQDTVELELFQFFTSQ